MSKPIFIGLFFLIFYYFYGIDIQPSWGYDWEKIRNELMDDNVKYWFEDRLMEEIEFTIRERITFVPMKIEDIIAGCENSVDRFMKRRRLTPLNLRIRKINDCLEDEILRLGEFMLKYDYVMKFKHDAPIAFQKIYESIRTAYQVDNAHPTGEPIRCKILESVTQVLVIILRGTIRTINQFQYSSEFPSKEYRIWYRNKFED